MKIKHGLVKLKGETFEVNEDENKIYFKEISDRKIKAHFAINKDKEKNKLAEYGLRVFFTELFSK
jgi:hypothetical protein